jgi:hypothetical protein
MNNEIRSILNQPPVLSIIDKSKIIKVTFKQFDKMNDIIDIPEIQGTLQIEKVNSMIDSYKKYKHHLLSRCLLTIAHCIVGNEEHFYLLDGQHRREAALQLVKENPDYNETMLLAIIEVNSQIEFNTLFEEINEDSSKCVYKNLPIFDKEIYEKLKKLLINNYDFLPKCSSSKNRLYEVSEFVELLCTKKIITFIKKNNDTANPKKIFNFLQKKDKEFFSKGQYLEIYNKNKDTFKIKEQDSINNKSAMFMKKNNFIDWILDENIEPMHDFNKRYKISKQLQKDVWIKEFQSLPNGKCPIFNCDNILTSNIINSWQCGHIISIKNGGNNDINNLKPICPACNQKMSSTNWENWENDKIKELIIDTYFDNDNPDYEICCRMVKNKCKNKININTFYSCQFTNEKSKSVTVKPICLKCHEL